MDSLSECWGDNARVFGVRSKDGDPLSELLCHYPRIVAVFMRLFKSMMIFRMSLETELMSCLRSGREYTEFHFDQVNVEEAKLSTLQVLLTLPVAQAWSESQHGAIKEKAMSAAIKNGSVECLRLMLEAGFNVHAEYSPCDFQS